MANAVVLLSGGLDSSTCLYEAKARGFSPIALSFNYGQRHKVELHSAKEIAKEANVLEHIILPINLQAVGGSAITDISIPIPLGGKDLDKPDFIPVTYVPLRNLILLSYACALAEARNIRDVFIGANALDYSGYPDCRPDFFDSFLQTANLASKLGRKGQSFKIHTPLLYLTKAEIIRRALELAVPLKKTWSCYNPQETANGFKPCGQCDACLLRKKGFLELGMEDEL